MEEEFTTLLIQAHEDLGNLRYLEDYLKAASQKVQGSGIPLTWRTLEAFNLTLKTWGSQEVIDLESLNVLIESFDYIMNRNSDHNVWNNFTFELGGLILQFLHAIKQTETYDFFFCKLLNTISVICEQNSGIWDFIAKHVMQSFIEKTFTYSHLQIALKQYICILRCIQNSILYNFALKNNDLLNEFSLLVQKIGDLESQQNVVEVVFMHTLNDRELLQNFFMSKSNEVNSLLQEFRFENFELDCRNLLNVINRNLKSNRKVFSINCNQLHFGGFPLDPPFEDSSSGIWMDANIDSGRLGITCANFQSGSFEPGLRMIMYMPLNDIVDFKAEIGSTNVNDEAYECYCITLKLINLKIAHKCARNNEIMCTALNVRNTQESVIEFLNVLPEFCKISLEPRKSPANLDFKPNQKVCTSFCAIEKLKVSRNEKPKLSSSVVSAKCQRFVEMNDSLIDPPTPSSSSSSPFLLKCRQKNNFKNKITASPVQHVGENVEMNLDMLANDTKTFHREGVSKEKLVIENLQKKNRKVKTPSSVLPRRSSRLHRSSADKNEHNKTYSDAKKLDKGSVHKGRNEIEIPSQISSKENHSLTQVSKVSKKGILRSDNASVHAISKTSKNDSKKKLESKSIVNHTETKVSQNSDAITSLDKDIFLKEVKEHVKVPYFKSRGKVISPPLSHISEEKSCHLTIDSEQKLSSDSNGIQNVKISEGQNGTMGKVHQSRTPLTETLGDSTSELKNKVRERESEHPEERKISKDKNKSKKFVDLCPKNVLYEDENIGTEKNIAKPKDNAEIDICRPKDSKKKLNDVLKIIREKHILPEKNYEKKRKKCLTKRIRTETFIGNKKKRQLYSEQKFISPNFSDQSSLEEPSYPLVNNINNKESVKKQGKLPRRIRKVHPKVMSNKLERKFSNKMEETKKIVRNPSLLDLEGYSYRRWKEGPISEKGRFWLEKLPIKADDANYGFEFHDDSSSEMRSQKKFFKKTTNKKKPINYLTSKMKLTFKTSSISSKRRAVSDIQPDSNSSKSESKRILPKKKRRKTSSELDKFKKTLTKAIEKENKNLCKSIMDNKTGSIVTKAVATNNNKILKTMELSHELENPRKEDSFILADNADVHQSDLEFRLETDKKRDSSNTKMISELEAHEKTEGNFSTSEDFTLVNGRPSKNFILNSSDFRKNSDEFLVKDLGFDSAIDPSLPIIKIDVDQTGKYLISQMNSLPFINSQNTPKNMFGSFCINTTLENFSLEGHAIIDDSENTPFLFRVNENAHQDIKKKHIENYELENQCIQEAEHVITFLNEEENNENLIEKYLEEATDFEKEGKDFRPQHDTPDDAYILENCTVTETKIKELPSEKDYGSPISSTLNYKNIVDKELEGKDLPLEVIPTKHSFFLNRFEKNMKNYEDETENIKQVFSNATSGLLKNFSRKEIDCISNHLKSAERLLNEMNEEATDFGKRAVRYQRCIRYFQEGCRLNEAQNDVLKMRESLTNFCGRKFDTDNKVRIFSSNLKKVINLQTEKSIKKQIKEVSDNILKCCSVFKSYY